MGEACFRGNASYGDGVYKSTDAGKTWTHLGLEATRQIGRLQVDPTQSRHRATSPRLAMRGGPIPSAASTAPRDGGRTWQKVLFRNENAGAIDIVLDPGKPNVLYATTLELRRYPWGFRSAGPGTAIYKSTDGGDTWTDLSSKPACRRATRAASASPWRRRGPTACGPSSTPPATDQGIYRSDDGGETWTHLTDNADLTQRPWYYHHIFADPKNPDVLWALNVDLWKSTDGGTNFQEVVGAARRQPRPVDRSAGSAADGRGRTTAARPSRSTAAGRGPRSQPADGAALSRGHRQPGAVPRLRGAAGQHHRSRCRAARTTGAITIEEWETVGGGEDGYVAPSLSDPNIVYAADHHWLHRYDRRTKQVRDISPNPETHYGWGAADINFRFWWTFPVMLSPHDPKTLYVTSQKSCTGPATRARAGR